MRKDPPENQKRPLSEMLHEINTLADEIQIKLGIGFEIAAVSSEPLERLVALNNVAESICEKLGRVKGTLAGL